ncbi:HalOD1 output domain-containing protein [Natrinema sp. CBA1119]|uniref:HalOD1 output domain-containing protein n=1 Tax=Natrinema sp. CBA1119 TaxID=1608465 RepID=UPI001145538C|nr:HalOD1 output domain-containing protein [Natrinema sp. CBA1119]
MTEHDTGPTTPSAPTPDSVQVIKTIADHLDQDPTEVDFTFSDYLDPDALDSLLESSTEELVVAFTIEDLLVTVANDGTIEVRDHQN